MLMYVCLYTSWTINYVRNTNCVPSVSGFGELRNRGFHLLVALVRYSHLLGASCESTMHDLVELLNSKLDD